MSWLCLRLLVLGFVHFGFSPAVFLPATIPLAVFLLAVFSLAAFSLATFPIIAFAAAIFRCPFSCDLDLSGDMRTQVRTVQSRSREVWLEPTFASIFAKLLKNTSNPRLTRLRKPST